MGERGPVPKRSNQRRRTNKPETPVVHAPGTTAPPPDVDDKWHPIARRWFEALAISGQSAFYQASDWATALVLAESLSRDLKPQVVGLHPETGKPVRAVVPLKGASLSAYLKGFSALLITEGDRRRVRLELERGTGDEANAADVSEIDEYRNRLTG